MFPTEGGINVCLHVVIHAKMITSQFAMFHVIIRVLLVNG